MCITTSVPQISHLVVDDENRWSKAFEFALKKGGVKPPGCLSSRACDNSKDIYLFGGIYEVHFCESGPNTQTELAELHWLWDLSFPESAVPDGLICLIFLAPEKGWLEDDPFLLGFGLFSVATVVSREGFYETTVTCKQKDDHSATASASSWSHAFWTCNFHKNN